MTINNLLPLLPVVAGPAISLVAEAARRVPIVPFDPKTAAGMRLAVLFVSTAAGFGLAYLSGTPGAFDWDTALRGLVDAAIIYAGAVATHDHALDKPSP